MKNKPFQPLFASLADDADSPAKPPPAVGQPPATLPPEAAAANLPAAMEVAGELNAPFSLAGKKVFLVDSHSLIYQVFHALPEMSGPSGQPVGAVQGFIRDVLDMMENRHADAVVCAFDAPGPNFRHALNDQYKIHRDEMPGDLQTQIPVIRDFLDALGVPSPAIPGFEADDLLATLAQQVVAGGGCCLLVTSDKDCRQLISPQVKMLNLRKGEEYDEAALAATWGIRPDQVVDFQSLVGDSVDNVKGVPGIGPKTATELLQKYGTLEGVYEHLEELKGKRKENLLAGRDSAFQSRELVRLKRDIPLDFDWSAARIGGFDRERLAELSRQCGFRQLAKRFETLADRIGTISKPSLAATTNREQNPAWGEAATDGSPAPNAELPATTSPSESFSLTDSPAAPDNWQADYRAITTPEELQALVAELSGCRRLSIDTETTSIHPRHAELVGISLCAAPGAGYYLPIRAPEGEPRLPESLVLDALRPLLEDEQVAKVGQNIKYDLIVLRSAGVTLRGLGFDTMVADYLLDPGERSHNLDDLSRRKLGHETIKIESLIGSGKKQKRMDEAPLALITPYAAEDADVALRLADLLAPDLDRLGLRKLFDELEMPLIEVLAELEFNGIRVDRERLVLLGEGLTAEIARLEQEIHALAGAPFNINSGQQLGKLLFEKFNLPIIKRTKTGPSVDAEVLEELAALHELPAKVIEYRQNAKLKSTYVEALQELIHPQTGRVHTSFKQDVAATGRLSSQDPNLQNIPVRTAQGRAIRSAFLPGPPGWKLMTADYSQIELRVLAHFSSDATLLAAFADDRDIHAQVASEVYATPLAEVTKEMRRSAKAINFGVIYGQSPFGLAKQLGIDKKEAAKFIQAYFARLPGVEEFMRRTLLDCRRDGFVSTILGRRRPVEGVRNYDLLEDKRQRTLPERIAINTVIQGSAADIIKQAMIRLQRRLHDEKFAAKMLLQIHDELVLEYPPEEEQPLAAVVAEEMSGAITLSTPLKVDVKTGPNWAACEAIE